MQWQLLETMPKNKSQALEILIALIFHVYIYQHMQELFYDGLDWRASWS